MKTHNHAVLMVLGCLAFLWSGPVCSYDADTHALIGIYAYRESVLNPTDPDTVVARLGLDRLGISATFAPYWVSRAASAYYDNTPTLNGGDPPSLDVLRFPSGYELCKIRNLARASAIPAGDTMVRGGFIYYTIENWIIRGVIREDDVVPDNFARDNCAGSLPEPDPRDPFNRVLSHFYDPINDRPLKPYGIPCASIPYPLHGSCNKSVDWALGVVDSFAPAQQADPSRANHFTYVDARENYWLALTGERGRETFPYTAAAKEADSAERLYRWATVFRALGDVIHLVQDGAQPQHVRNDPHDPTSTQEQQAFEHYTNWRVIGDPSGLNAYVRGFFDQGTALVPVPINLTNAYPIPAFATPLRFFTTRQANDGPNVLPDTRYGMMDYTNRGFFTGNTLPGDFADDFLEPPSTVDEAHGYTAAEVPCALSAQITSRFQVGCTHWTHTVHDSVAPGYQDFLPDSFSAPPLLEESVLREFVDIFGQPAFPSYAVGLEEFQAMANLNIPRAIAYSAGMIDYFFRGQLALTSPPDGLYAVTDQGIPHQVSPDGIPVESDGQTTFGFKTVRVRVKNATPTLIDPGLGAVSQTMGAGIGPDGSVNGYLVAIARYHRNPCYQPDLSGEYISVFHEDGTITGTVRAGCTTEQMRTEYQEISVSAPVFLDDAGNLPGAGSSVSPCANVGNINTGATGDCANDSALMEFEFSADPIPINATDLFLQVAYRGQLGQETDGIAVGAVDLVEPNYLTVLNNEDWTFNENNQPPWSPVDPPGVEMTQVKTCLNSQAVTLNETLEPAEFLRVAFLSDQPFVSDGETDSYSSFQSPFPEPLIPRQSDKENGGTFVNSVYNSFFDATLGMIDLRGTTAGFEWIVAVFDPIGEWTGTISLDAAIEHLHPDIGSPLESGLPREVSAINFTSTTDSDCAFLLNDQSSQSKRTVSPGDVTSPLRVLRGSGISASASASREAGADPSH